MRSPPPRSPPLPRSLAWPLLVALVLAGCAHAPTERERQGAQSRYELGVAAQEAGNVREAYQEYQRALELDPDHADAHNALGILLHLAFRKLDDAIEHYRRALKVRPTFSEAKTNLANVYLDQARYDEAIRLYEQALNDMLYPTPYIAQGNLGWAHYKKGDTRQALENIRAAVTTNPKFCLGYKNLGLIYEDTGDSRQACQQYTRYREACPDAADAWLREGGCLARAGQVDAARAAFATCETKAQRQDLKDECRRLHEQL